MMALVNTNGVTGNMSMLVDSVSLNYNHKAKAKFYKIIRILEE